MPGQIKIDQVGLPPGVAGVARTDGLSTGAPVTLTSVGAEGVTQFVLLWGPPDDTTAEASLAPTGDPNVWTFSPTAGAVGTYTIQLLEDGLVVQERVFGVRTPNKGLLIPALNERASKVASWANDGADQVLVSQDNANDYATPALNNYRYAGWWRSQHELYKAVDAASGGGAPTSAEYVLGASNGSLPNGRVATASSEITPGLGLANVITWALNTASVAFAKLADLTGLSVLGRASASAGVMAAITASGARQALLSNAAGDAIAWRGLELADLPAIPAPTWAQVLAAGATGNNSGAFNPHVDTGQFLGFGDEGSLPGSGQVRSSANFTVNVTGIATVQGSTNAFLLGSGGLARFGIVSGVAGIRTNATDRLQILTTGDWQIGASVGTAGQYNRSSGPGAPPTWATITVGELGAIGANTVVTNPTAGSAAPSTTALATHSVLARIGGNIVSHALSTLSGDGLGYDSVNGAIFVGAGSFITVAANDVSVNLAALVPAIDSASVVANGTVLERAAITGAVSLAQNSNAALFAGIRDNGVLETARTHLNFVSVALDTAVSVTQDAANDELEVRVSTLGSFYSENSVGSFQTKFISFDNGSDTLAQVVDNTGGSGFVNVSFDVNKAAGFTWTGAHAFNGTTLSANTSAGISLSAGSGWNALGTTLTLTSTSGDLDLSSGGDVDISAATAIELRAGGNVLLQHDGGDEVVVQSDDGTGGFVHIEAAATGPTVAGGFGAFWSRLDGSGTFPCFTDVDDVDVILQFAEDRLNALATQTNSTNNAIATSHTVPANTVRAGDTYRLTGCYRYDRGATATASQLRGFFSVGGAITVSTGNISTQTANGSSGTIRIEAIVTFLADASAATPYTASVLLIDTIASATVVTRLPAPSLTATVNATADFSLSIRAQFTAAVANLSVTALQGCVERIG